MRHLLKRSLFWLLLQEAEPPASVSSIVSTRKAWPPSSSGCSRSPTTTTGGWSSTSLAGSPTTRPSHTNSPSPSYVRTADPFSFCSVSSLRIIHAAECLHKQRVDLDLITCCVGELCTIHRNGIPWPVIYGIGVNVRTGDIFPATFTDKGPDLDIRIARTLTGGENVGVSVAVVWKRHQGH